jgi:hypothetical protein
MRCRRCGKFLITDEAIYLLQEAGNKDRRYLISAAARRGSDAGGVPELLTYSIDEIWRTTSAPRTPFEVIDQLLLHIHRHTTNFAGGVRILLDDYPLFTLRSGTELKTFASHLQSLGYIELGAEGGDALICRLTLKGWQRVPELQKVGKASDQAFVAMWFAPELDEAWREGILPAFDGTGWRPVRVDSIEHNDKIDDRIVAEIRRSGLVVADVTGHRAGVYFEAGLAMGLGLPVVWMVRADHLEGVHFDTRQYNHIVWTTPAELREKLRNRLLATFPL